MPCITTHPITTHPVTTHLTIVHHIPIQPFTTHPVPTRSLVIFSTPQPTPHNELQYECPPGGGSPHSRHLPQLKCISCLLFNFRIFGAATYQSVPRHLTPLTSALCVCCKTNKSHWPQSYFVLHFSNNNDQRAYLCLFLFDKTDTWEAKDLKFGRVAQYNSLFVDSQRNLRIHCILPATCCRLSLPVALELHLWPGELSHLLLTPCN